MKAQIFLVLIVFFASMSFGANMRPQWQNGATVCPSTSAVDHYITVPLFHNLEALGEVNRIPGLNLNKPEQEEFANHKLSIYYETFAPFDPTKELLILIPGGPGQPHADLHKLVELLQTESGLLNQFNVIAMDHRGVGCSRPHFPGDEPERALLMRQAAADIEMIRKELVGETGKIHVFGYSYGSILAQTYALLFPKNLGRLFLGGSVASYEEFHLAGVQYEGLLFSAVKDDQYRKFLSLVANEPKLKRAFFDWGFSQLYQFWGRTRLIPEKLTEIMSLIEAGKNDVALQSLKIESGIIPWMSRSIGCTELFPFQPIYENEYPIWERYFSPCSEFKNQTEFFNYLPLLRQIEAETLVFGGWFDHVTPGKAMVRISQAIPNSFIYLDPHMGHGFSGKLKCILTMIGEFFKGANHQRLQEISYSRLCQDPPDLEEIQSEMNSQGE